MSRRGKIQRPSPRELLKDAMEDPVEEIKFKYDEAHFSAIKEDPDWKPLGDINWAKDREEWISHVQEGETERLEYTHDVDQIATNIQQYRRFEDPVPLDLLAEILELSWIEAPTI